MGVIVKLLAFVHIDIVALAAETIEEANELWKFDAFICTTCTAPGSLRAYGGFFVNMVGLEKYIELGKGGEILSCRINKILFSPKRNAWRYGHPFD